MIRIQRCGQGLPAVCLFLAIAISARPADAATSPTNVNFNLNFSGTEAAANLKLAGSGTGTITPFGNAQLAITGSGQGKTFTFGLQFTFENGDSFSAVVMGPAKVPFVSTGGIINGGTGLFQGSSGLIGVSFVEGVSSNDFILTGSGEVILNSAFAGGPGFVTVFPSGLSFSLQQGGGSSSQLVVVDNQNYTAARFDATATTLAGGNWLSVSPASASANPLSSSAISVTVNSSGLSAGQYEGLVVVTSNGNSYPVDVRLSVTSAGPGLLLSQTGLQFQTAVGANAVLTEPVIVTNSGSGTLSFNASVLTLSGTAGWLTATPATAAVSAAGQSVVTIGVNPTGLVVGDYYGRVDFTAAGASNSPQSVLVVFSVVSTGVPPMIPITPTGLLFVAASGGAIPPNQTVGIINSWTQTLTLSTSVFFEQGTNWLSVTPTSATLMPGQPLTLTVSINPAGLTPGVYNAVVHFTFAQDGSDHPVSVVLVVTPPGVTPGASSIKRVLTRAESVKPRGTAACTPTKILPVFSLLGDTFRASAAWPAPLQVDVADDCGSPLLAGSVTISFSSADRPLALVPLGSGRWGATWVPYTAASPVTLTVLAQTPGSTFAGETQISGVVAANPGVPVIGRGGVVSAASFEANAPVAPGAFVSIFGAGFSSTPTGAPSLPLATMLAGTQVTLGGRVLPLSFTGSGQINAIVPYDTPVNSTQQLIVQQGNAYSQPEPVTVAAAQPGVFSQGQGVGVIVVIKPDGTEFEANAASPASAGDALAIYCAGLGSVSPPVPDGAAAPFSPLSRTDNPVSVTVGGLPAQVLFAGLAPGFAGLYQVNVVVPTGIASASNVPVVLTAGGESSTPATIAIR